MSDLVLKRYLYDEDFGTFGYMYIDGVKVWTIERPWLKNKKMVSCIPTGTYHCQLRFFYRGGYDAIEIMDVPNRTNILFHKANLASELAGCIAPGMFRGCLKKQWAVLRSGKAFDLLMENWGHQHFILEVRDK